MNHLKSFPNLIYFLLTVMQTTGYPDTGPASSLAFEVSSYISKDTMWGTEGKVTSAMLLNSSIYTMALVAWNERRVITDLLTIRVLGTSLFQKND